MPVAAVSCNKLKPNTAAIRGHPQGDAYRRNSSDIHPCGEDGMAAWAHSLAIDLRRKDRGRWPCQCGRGGAEKKIVTRKKLSCSSTNIGGCCECVKQLSGRSGRALLGDCFRAWIHLILPSWNTG